MLLIKLTTLQHPCCALFASCFCHNRCSIWNPPWKSDFPNHGPLFFSSTFLKSVFDVRGTSVRLYILFSCFHTQTITWCADMGRCWLTTLTTDVSILLFVTCKWNAINVITGSCITASEDRHQKPRPCSDWLKMIQTGAFSRWLWRNSDLKSW